MKLQQAIIESYRQRFEDSDPGYFDEKASPIFSMSFIEAMRNLVWVDDEGLEIVAELTNTTPDFLRSIRSFVIEQTNET